MLKQCLFERNVEFKFVGSSILNPGLIAETIFENWDYGHAFAYLYRRFGPPFWGSDDYKELVCYELITSHKDIILTISPKFSVRRSFGYGVTTKLNEKLDMERVNNNIKRRLRETLHLEVKNYVEKMLTKAMMELKKPVSIRDSLINIEGKIDSSQRDCIKQYSELAGYGITPDYYDKFNE